MMLNWCVVEIYQILLVPCSRIESILWLYKNMLKVMVLKHSYVELCIERIGIP